MCDNQNVPSHEGFNRAEWVAFVEKMNITDVNVIDMLNNTRPEAKEEFLTAHELSRPNNVYAQLDIKRVEKNINTIIAHHPLIFKGVQNITNDSYGPIIRKLIQNDIQLIALHTNLDVYDKGVSYMIGQKIGLTNMEILDKQNETYYKLQIFIPDENVEEMKKAFDNNQLAQTEEYSNVFFQSQGKGQFKPSENANPHIGTSNKTEIVYETKLELMIDGKDKALATRLLYEYHPYEEPVFDFIKMEKASSVGLGIIGELPQ